MLLEGKNAIVWGGGGAIGGAVARAFGREGARVFLAGRTQVTLDAVAHDIRAAGGRADTAIVDALDEAQVEAHADAVAAETGGIDVALNVIGHNDVQGTPLVDMQVDDFLRPVVTALRTNFLTSRAVARHMLRRNGGVVLLFGGHGDPLPEFNLGGLQVAFGALEYLRRALATELGRHGVRVVTLQTAGVPESIPDWVPGTQDIVQDIVGRTLLGRAATLADVGNVAAFAASDSARTITASAINISCGTTVG